MNLLIVEDDINLANTLKQIVNDNGYLADIADNGVDGVFYASNSSYDAIILDVMLPKMDGFNVIKMIRNQNINTPTLMLTAKSEIADKIQGLDSGADDYMTKPFSPEELLARLRAIMRRKGEVIKDEIIFEGLTLNIATYELSFMAKSILLSNKEFNIMRIFLSSPNTVISKESLINKIWGADSNAEDNNVEAYISFLRKKMVFLGADKSVKISTIRRAGYKLEKIND